MHFGYTREAIVLAVVVAIQIHSFFLDQLGGYVQVVDQIQDDGLQFHLLEFADSGENFRQVEKILPQF